MGVGSFILPQIGGTKEWQCILDAQAERLEVLLGEKLYEKICADYDADNLEDEYLILYTEYIK